MPAPLASWVLHPRKENSRVSETTSPAALVDVGRNRRPGTWGPRHTHWPKTLRSGPETARTSPATETLHKPAAPRPRAAPHQPGPRGAAAGTPGLPSALLPQPAPRLGRAQSRGATSHAREGPARGAAAAHLGTQPAARQGGGQQERTSRSPTVDNVYGRPQPPAPGAYFQIASSSRGRVFFRRPETRAPPPPR
jgi:hypothetical protein